MGRPVIVFVPGSVRVRGVPGVTNNSVFSGVNSIVITTFGGNDRVTVGLGLTRAAGGLMGVTVDAGQGTDVIVGGDGDDTILGGDGRDTLRDSRGNDDDDSLSDLRRGSTEDSGDNGNDDLDENEDADDDDGDPEDDEDESGDDNGGDDTPAGPVLAFASGSETLTGTSASKRVRVFYSFTVPVQQSWTLNVTLTPVNNRYPDLEIERKSSGLELQFELEPTDNPAQASGRFTLPAGTYSLRLRSPDLQPVNYNVSLTRTVMA